jgi:hypothetical protein
MEKMLVIPEPDPTRRRVIEGDAIPYVNANGVGDESYQCGACDTVLVKDSWAWTIRNLAFRCPSCGACNVEKTSSLL